MLAQGLFGLYYYYGTPNTRMCVNMCWLSLTATLYVIMGYAHACSMLYILICYRKRQTLMLMLYLMAYINGQYQGLYYVLLSYLLLSDSYLLYAVLDCILYNVSWFVLICLIFIVKIACYMPYIGYMTIWRPKCVSISLKKWHKI